MNLIDFEQIGGYRLKQTTFAKIQEAYFEILKAYIGHLGIADVGNFIISGCEIVGLNITSGLMYINGELCPFETVLGDANSKIKKEIELNDLDFADGLPKSVFRKSIAVVDAVNGIALSLFVRVPKVNELVNELTDWSDILNIPQVVIDPYNPVSIPAEKTVLQRLTEVEKKLKIFIAGGVVFPWFRPLFEIPDGFAVVTSLKGKTIFGMDDRLKPNSTDFLNPEFAPLPNTNGPGRSGGSKETTFSNDNLQKIEGTFGYITPLGSTTSGNVVIVSESPASIDGNVNGYKFQVAKFSIGKDVPDKKTILNPFETAIYIEYVD